MNMIGFLRKLFHQKKWKRFNEIDKIDVKDRTSEETRDWFSLFDYFYGEE